MTRYTDHAATTEQLTAELGELVGALDSFIGGDTALEALLAIERRAPELAWQLDCDDELLVGQTVRGIMVALWPHGSPEECGQPAWWQTPLGRLCARSLGVDEHGDVVSHATAAAMTGLASGSIGPYVARGVLRRHPSGGVERASVLRWVANRGQHEPTVASTTESHRESGTPPDSQNQKG